MIVDDEGYIMLTGGMLIPWRRAKAMKIYDLKDPLPVGYIALPDIWSPTGYVALTHDEYTQWVKSKDTPLGLPAPEPPCDWDDSEVTPPNGQPLNCYYCNGETRTTRWGVPICKACDKKCREHA